MKTSTRLTFISKTISPGVCYTPSFSPFTRGHTVPYHRGAINRHLGWPLLALKGYIPPSHPPKLKVSPYVSDRITMNWTPETEGDYTLSMDDMTVLTLIDFWWCFSEYIFWVNVSCFEWEKLRKPHTLLYIIVLSFLWKVLCLYGYTYMRYYIYINGQYIFTDQPNCSYIYLITP